MVGVIGLEPMKPEGGRFTVSCSCRCAILPKFCSERDARRSVERLLSMDAYYWLFESLPRTHGISLQVCTYALTPKLAPHFTAFDIAECS